MKTTHNLNMSHITSFGTGGVAELFIEVDKPSELTDIIASIKSPVWVIGRGNNILVSDDGLPGTTIQMNNKDIDIKNNGEITVGAGVEWDEYVKTTIDNNLWGAELMSGIPSSVGAAITGNIAAYGQAISDTLSWVKAIDYSNGFPRIEKITRKELGFSYRNSNLGNRNGKKIIIEANFKLSESKTCDVVYESAKKIASHHNFDLASLEGRRKAIIKTREKAGSLYDINHHQKTAGSFFKNPVVSNTLVNEIMAYEENAITKQAILKQNKLHGGDSLRVSAAHVLRAAGFHRGQNWGQVRLHPDHILKIENTSNASSQQIYDVATEIIETVKSRLDITLEPEVKFLGKFN